MKVAILFLSIILASCSNAIKEAGSSLEKATANFKDGLTKVSQGLDSLSKIDPIALNKLINENTELRNQVAAVNQRLNSISGSGFIELNKRKVQLLFPEYIGNFIVNAYIDTVVNILWDKRRLDNKQIVLPFNFDDKIVRGRFFFPNIYEINAQASITNCRNHANEVFSNFLKTTSVLPGGQLTPLDLNSRFGDGLSHWLKIELIPTKGDENGRWSIHTQIRLVSEDGKTIENVAEADRDSDQFPQHRLGQPLQTIVIPLRLKI